jgi:hypothetical protein
VFSCELLPVLEHVFANERLLELLFSFLDEDPEKLDPSYCAHFRKVMVVLIRQKHDQVVFLPLP